MSDSEVKYIADKIFTLKEGNEFENAALKIFRYQAGHCQVYKEFLGYLRTDIKKIDSIYQIPFMPVVFFKTKKIYCSEKVPDHIFYSSGTTGTTTSKHYVNDLSLYEKSFASCFKLFYGKISDYRLLALLPSYLDRKGSSLVYMVKHLINISGHSESGFYLNNIDELAEKLSELEKHNTKVLLIGVSFALLELAEKYRLNLKNTVIMETGGMKGTRKELTRAELHSILIDRLGTGLIHSEYGMTELLSQAYSYGNGAFGPPPWMKILVRDIYDPFTYLGAGKAGGMNIIDLANIWSCSFIETQDIGRLDNKGQFEVEGRIDSSDIRGCNLMVQE